MATEPVRVIGLRGLPSSGKGETTFAFRRLAAARGWRAEHISFSDRIKDEARARGIDESAFTRDLLSRIGTELRETEGPGVLSKRIVRMMYTVESMWRLKKANARGVSFKDYFQAGKSVSGIDEILPAAEVVRQYAAAML